MDAHPQTWGSSCLGIPHHHCGRDVAGCDGSGLARLILQDRFVLSVPCLAQASPAATIAVRRRQPARAPSSGRLARRKDRRRSCRGSCPDAHSVPRRSKRLSRRSGTSRARPRAGHAHPRQAGWYRDDRLLPRRWARPRAQAPHCRLPAPSQTRRWTAFRKHRRVAVPGSSPAELSRQIPVRRELGDRAKTVFCQNCEYHP